MNESQQSIKQEFIIELMVFSPKYNATTAELLASQLSDEEIKEYLEKLRRINEAEAEELAGLEESDPTQYEKRVKEREEAEQIADDAFYETVEDEVQKDTEETDKEYLKAEEEVDTAVQKAEEDMDKAYMRAESLVKAFFDEVSDKEIQKEEIKQPKQDMKIEDVQSEIQGIINKASGDASATHITQAIDHEVEEKKADNWQ